MWCIENDVYVIKLHASVGRCEMYVKMWQAQINCFVIEECTNIFVILSLIISFILFGVLTQSKHKESSSIRTI